PLTSYRKPSAIINSFLAPGSTHQLRKPPGGALEFAHDTPRSRDVEHAARPDRREARDQFVPVIEHRYRDRIEPLDQVAPHHAKTVAADLFEQRGLPRLGQPGRAKVRLRRFGLERWRDDRRRKVGTTHQSEG